MLLPDIFQRVRGIFFEALSPLTVGSLILETEVELLTTV